MASPRVSGILIAALSIFSFCPSSYAQVTTSITSSGLNTQVSAPVTLPSGQTQIDITGGTRPGNGTNLFHSFGNFSIGSNAIGNFLNETGLPTTNILGRVTGGNPSNIFGTLQTTGFGNANLFLMNPAGVIFGPTATLNIGGALTVTTANYAALADGARFNALPGPQDALLSTAPLAAFGFLGANLPAGQSGMITVQPGAVLSVSPGQSFTLVGRDNPKGVGQQAGIAITGGVLEAEAGQVNLVSVGRPKNPSKGGEVAVQTSGTLLPSGFKENGTVVIAEGSTLSVNSLTDNRQAGTISIRAGELVISDSSLTADGGVNQFVFAPAGSVEIHAQEVSLDDALVSANSWRGSGGQISFNDLSTMESVQSNLSAGVIHHLADDATTRGGSIRIGSSDTKSVTLVDTALSASTMASANTGIVMGDAGDITITGKILNISGGSISSIAGFQSSRSGGTITLQGDRIAVTDSSFSSYNWSNGGAHLGGGIILQGLESTETIPSRANAVVVEGSTLVSGQGVGTEVGGDIILRAKDVTLEHSTLRSNGSRQGGVINLEDVGTLRGTDSILSAGSFGAGGTILLGSDNAQSIVLEGSTVTATSVNGSGGTINIRSGKRFESNGSTLDVSSALGNAGTINITAGKQFQSAGSTINAASVQGQGGNIMIHSGKLSLTDGSTLDAQGAAGPGTISLQADKKLTIKDSSITPAPIIE